MVDGDQESELEAYLCQVNIPGRESDKRRLLGL